MAVDDFLARRDGHFDAGTPIAVAGRLTVRPWCDWKTPYLHVDQPPGACAIECHAVLTLVSSKTDQKPKRARGGAWFREAEMEDYAPSGRAGGGRGISLIDLDDTPMTCSGDLSGTCCPYPVDGADIVVRFAASVARESNISLPAAAAGDDHHLRVESICRMEGA